LFVGIGIGAAATPEEEALEAQPPASLSTPSQQAVAPPAHAHPDGHEGDVAGHGYFALNIQEINGAPLPKDVYDSTRFTFTDGWDFGDRIGYRCAWVEWFRGQNERFEVHYEMVTDYPVPAEINDLFGAEVGGDQAYLSLCGDGLPDNTVPVVWDDSDHFPHMIHPGDGIAFSERGVPLLDAQGTPVFLDLTHDQCSKSYWVPGDEAGEAWLWWDKDGPTFSHSPGEGELPCGGGPGEPVAVVRLSVRNADPDIGYCTVAMDERLCS
jgi:hypothetical protein